MKFVRNKTKDAAKKSAAPAPAASGPRRAPRKPSGGGDGKLRGAKRFVLMIGDEGAILVFMQGATVVRRLFAASPAPDHTGAVLELLNANPKVPLSVLIDVLDQQYVRHTFPPVSSLSLGGLLKRRIDRDFRNEDIVGSIKLGREKTGRKEWIYLLIGLAYTPLIQQWFDLLVEQPNELKGIYLVPAESQHYIKHLHDMLSNEKPLPWQLLVSHHKVSGFRQVVLREGKLVFTRVTQAIDDALPAVVAGNIEQEIMNTLEYLRRLGFLEPNTLEIMVIAAAEVGDALDLNRFKAGQSWSLTPLDIAEGLGFEQAALSADRFGDVVLCSDFGRTRSHALKLMTAYAQKLSVMYNARRGIKLVGALLALLLLGMSAMNMIAAIGDNGAASDTEAQRRPIQEQLASVRKAVSGLDEDVAFKTAIMLSYDAYLKDAKKPDEFISQIAPLLPAEVRVLEFKWNNTGKPTDALPAASTPGVTGPVEVQLELEFTGTYESVEVLSKAVTDAVAALKKGLPDYDIVNKAFPWEGQKPTSTEFTFGESKKEGLPKDSNKVTLVIRGPKGGVAGGAPAPAMGVAP